MGKHFPSRIDYTAEFKKLILHRKKTLNYLAPKKNTTQKRCDSCLYMDSMSPYMHRCELISYGEERFCAVNMEGVCDKHNKEWRDDSLVEKYENIEFENMFPMIRV